jgi:hypothetical protein
VPKHPAASADTEIGRRKLYQMEVRNTAADTMIATGTAIQVAESHADLGALRTTDGQTHRSH